jgi:hypothetical protein
MDPGLVLDDGGWVMAKLRMVLVLVGLVVLGGAGLGARDCSPAPVEPQGCDPAEKAACVTHGVWNDETCTCCAAGAHQVQACEFGQGGTFDWLACACIPPECVYNLDCAFGDECDGGHCVPSECHAGNPFDPRVPERRCPGGLMCMMGDGVDLNHGNGWCE